MTQLCEKKTGHCFDQSTSFLLEKEVASFLAFEHQIRLLDSNRQALILFHFKTYYIFDKNCNITKQTQDIMDKQEGNGNEKLSSFTRLESAVPVFVNEIDRLKREIEIQKDRNRIQEEQKEKKKKDKKEIEDQIDKLNQESQFKMSNICSLTTHDAMAKSSNKALSELLIATEVELAAGLKDHEEIIKSYSERLENYEKKFQESRQEFGELSESNAKLNELEDLSRKLDNEIKERNSEIEQYEKYNEELKAKVEELKLSSGNLADPKALVCEVADMMIKRSKIRKELLESHKILTDLEKQFEENKEANEAMAAKNRSSMKNFFDSLSIFKKPSTSNIIQNTLASAKSNTSVPKTIPFQIGKIDSSKRSNSFLDDLMNQLNSKKPKHEQVAQSTWRTSTATPESLKTTPGLPFAQKHKIFQAVQAPLKASFETKSSTSKDFLGFNLAPSTSSVTKVKEEPKQAFFERPFPQGFDIKRPGSAYIPTSSYFPPESTASSPKIFQNPQEMVNNPASQENTSISSYSGQPMFDFYNFGGGDQEKSSNNYNIF